MTRPAISNNPSIPSHAISIKIHFAAFLGYLLAGCQPVVATPAMPSYSLTVVNGFGSGRYQAGSTVHVWANPYQQGWTFDIWNGDTQPLPDIRSMHATMIMPAQDIQIEATYKEIPVWSVSHASIAGRDVSYYFPSTDYKGVILFFHGSGGDAREWSNLGMERRHFFDDAIAEGYAVLALDSGDRLNKQWDLDLPPASNPDLEAVEAILTSFRADGWMSAETPLYGVGMSQGGRFATLAGYTLGMKATAIWVGAEHEEITSITTVPTIWCLADHDPIIDREEVLAQYQKLIKRHVDAIFYVHTQTPLYPLYFVNIEGIDEAASERLFSEFQSRGYLDSDNFLIENPRLSGWEKHIGLEYPESARLDIQDRLFVAYAEHAFYSDCDHLVLDFFDSHP
ncbi:MAG: alpha/beta fold hydrolase [Anaerolineales bacterium]|nr:alpha/beta fold hydrolase [Anaerolineales bacterium]